VGGFNGCTWDSFAVILPYALFGIAVCVFLPYKMNILMLGDENADSLGMNTALFRIFLIAVSSLLAGAAVSVGGTHQLCRTHRSAYRTAYHGIGLQNSFPGFRISRVHPCDDL
jgi:ABC-type cobalamin transport system permease subunit